MIRAIVLLMAGGAGILAQAADPVDLYETYKGQVFEKEYTGLGDNGTFTLSQDFAFTNASGVAQSLRYKEGDTFDFSDGNHTLTCAGLRTYSNGTGKTVTFKGGVWNLSGKGNVALGGWSNLPLTDWTWTFEDVVFTNLSGAIGFDGYGSNMRALLKRTAVYCGSASYYTLLGGLTTWSPYGALMEFSEGSKLYSKSATYLNRDYKIPSPLNFTLRFTGKGSGYIRVNGTSNNDFNLGNKSPCERVEVLDEATFSTRYLYVGVSSTSNAMYVADGSLSGGSSITLGADAGSDYNELTVTGPKGRAEVGYTASFVVGQNGAFNTLTVSNGAQLAASYIRMGYSSASATNNLVRVVDGGVAEIDSRLDVGTKAGGNRVEIDGGSLQTLYSIRLGDGAPGNGIAVCNRGLLKSVNDVLKFCTSNNTLAVYSCATVDVKSVQMGMDSAETEGNLLLVSNATVRAWGDNAVALYGEGRVRICGTCPLVEAHDNKSGRIDFRDTTELTFALPADGTVYADAPFRAPNGVHFHSDSMTRFENLESFRSNLAARVDVPLARSTGDGTVGMADDYPEKINAALAAEGRSWAQFVRSDDQKLVFLRVKPPKRGTSIVIK